MVGRLEELLLDWYGWNLVRKEVYGEREKLFLEMSCELKNLLYLNIYLYV